MNSGDSLNAANAHSFDHQAEYLRGFVHRQAHGIERRSVIFGEGLAALVTAKALKAVAVFPELTAGGLAVVASHCESP